MLSCSRGILVAGCCLATSVKQHKANATVWGFIESDRARHIQAPITQPWHQEHCEILFKRFSHSKYQEVLSYVI